MQASQKILRICGIDQLTLISYQVTLNCYVTIPMEKTNQQPSKAANYDQLLRKYILDFRLVMLISVMPIKRTCSISFSFHVLVEYISVPFKGTQLSGQRLALGNQRFPVLVGKLAMCGGELSALITLLMSKCPSSRWKWQ